MDGWHTSSQVEVPEGIHLEFMPSHSPESTSRASVASNQEAVANQLFRRWMTEVKLFSAAVPY